MNTKSRLALAVPAVLACVSLIGRTGWTQTDKKPVFSHPTNITNPYLPLSKIQQEVFAGKEGEKSVRVVLTRKATKKTFVIDGKTITPFVLEDRETENGKLVELTLDYFAQDDAGSVYYLGEDVDHYRDGKVYGHEGAWHYGEANAHLGVLLPAHPHVGDKFQSENVPGVTTEDDEIVSVTETVTMMGKTFKDCVKVKENASDGGVEYKILAPGIGMVQDEKLKLVSRKEAKQ